MAERFDSAQALLRAVVERHSSIGSYSDHGVVHYWLKPDEEPQEVKFSTLFVRPGHFRFEFVTHHPYPPLRHITTRFVCGSDGHRHFLLREHPQRRALDFEESLLMAVAGAGGISAGAAYTIAQLLIPMPGQPTLADLERPRLRGDWEVDGVSCYDLMASDKKRGACRVCIRQSDLAVLRIKSSWGEIPHEEIRTDVVMGAPIPEESFVVPE